MTLHYDMCIRITHPKFQDIPAKKIPCCADFYSDTAPRLEEIKNFEVSAFKSNFCYGSKFKHFLEGATTDPRSFSLPSRDSSLFQPSNAFRLITSSFSCYNRPLPELHHIMLITAVTSQ